MLPMKTGKRAGAGKRLQKIFEDLPEEERDTLLAFAEFLTSRTPPKPVVPEVPVPHDRPKTESVVKAVRRLSATYPMLDKAQMLNQTSALMAQHVMQGRGAVEVIDELEMLFETHYHRYQKTQEQEGET